MLCIYSCTSSVPYRVLCRTEILIMVQRSPAPWCCLPARRARSRAHSRFLLPGRAAGRWRFLPDASRRPAPPAGCAGPPGRVGRPAVLRVRRRLPAAGRLAPGRSRRLSCAPAAETRCPPASPRTCARAPAQREVRPLAVGAKFIGPRGIPPRGSYSSFVSRCSAYSDQCPGAQERRGP